ncbi:MAG: hypothetical protein ABS939_03025 [Psychrobacillus sp.]
MAWDLFSLELDLDNNNEVNVVQSAITKNRTEKERSVLFEVAAAPTNEVLNDLMLSVGSTPQEKVQI